MNQQRNETLEGTNFQLELSKQTEINGQKIAQDVKIVQKKQQAPNFFIFLPYQGTFIFACTVVICLYYTAMHIKHTHQHLSQNNQLKQSFLTPYIFNLKRDAHDKQWQVFRSNIMISTAVMIVWKLLKIPLTFSFIPGVVLTIYAFRAGCIFYLAVITFWYLWTKIAYRFKYFVPICWIICLGILFLNEQSDHMKIISSYINYIIPDSIYFLRTNFAAISWSQPLNMTILRLLSFSIDYHKGDETKYYAKHIQKCKKCNITVQPNIYCQRARDLLPIPTMNLLNYFNYILFLPIFFTGPPISYKAFHSFSKHRITKKPRYLNLIILLATFQLYQHIAPVMPVNSQNSASQNFSIVLFNLVFVWYKFLVIWRFSKMWAAHWGIDVINNMGRCIFNNYGFQGFWRMWHRGFNHWLIRYLYIPLGGSKNYFSTTIVIIFVAFWHDHTLKIILWAGIILMFMIPQLFIKRYYRSHKNLHFLYGYVWFKYFCGFFCGVQIVGLIFSNVFGFGASIEGTQKTIAKIIQEWFFFIQILLVGIIGSVCMFYIRKLEKHKKNY